MRDFRRSGLACGSRDRDGHQEREPSTWKSKLICYRFWGIPHVFPLFRTSTPSETTPVQVRLEDAKPICGPHATFPCTLHERIKNSCSELQGGGSMIICDLCGEATD